MPSMYDVYVAEDCVFCVVECMCVLNRSGRVGWRDGEEREILPWASESVCVCV